MTEIERKKKAWLHFWPEGNGKAKQGFILHHKDPTLKTHHPSRYKLWIIEDLQMLSRGTHQKLHKALKKWADIMCEFGEEPFEYPVQPNACDLEESIYNDWHEHPFKILLNVDTEEELLLKVEEYKNAAEEAYMQMVKDGYL